VTDVQSARTQLEAGLYVDIHADGYLLVLTQESDGRTRGRITLSVDAVRTLDRFVDGLNSSAKTIEDAVKRLR